MKLTFVLINLFSFLLLLQHCLAYKSYQVSIPNGDKVAHPCIANALWEGVGHKNLNGGGERNPFGLAFANAGHEWTKELCAADSDGDGKTNGEELGDPSCVWSAGGVPSRTTDISHPGVCQPMDDAKCTGKNSFVSCVSNSFQDRCDVIKNTGIETVDVRLTKHTLPAAETTYMCMSFNLPEDQDYHIVADEPLIDNAYVVHHMMLYGCDDSITDFIASPTECEMSKCTSIIGGWSVGETGECYDGTVGFRIGSNGFKKAILEIHYDNPKLVSTYQDSSGLRLYYQPASDTVKDMFTMLTGQTMLVLPPGQSRIEKVGTCKSSCTATLFKEKVYLNSATNHMHLIGRSMKIELMRNGAFVKHLTNEETFDYNTPNTLDFDPPIEVLPGDEIITTCVYNSASSKHYVYYGDGTSDEMCYGYLTMFPKSALKSTQQNCVSVSTLSACELAQGVAYNGCDWKTLIKANNTEVMRIKQDLENTCDVTKVCSSQCQATVEKISNSCFQGQTASFVKSLDSVSSEVYDVSKIVEKCQENSSNRISINTISNYTPLLLCMTAVVKKIVL
ncbi:DBH-like monooxygenase protein 1 [Biomphalaria pfeifferi]|uniref:DBH-like monooxygenase protein 1 n=1 Tax=Biomphalaria pfeifferi TaxID=112525 RepID=A0AAD8APE5_BIOPF|nr:DBH-like monooxygenase protein 1 [Biomphalaria pfeifferi]